MKLASSDPPLQEVRLDLDQQAPPWRAIFPAPPGAWEVFRSYACLGSAEAIAGILRSQDVPARVEPAPGTCWPAPARHCVLVESRLAHRARWLLEEDAFSDTELSYLATGGFPGPDAD